MATWCPARCCALLFASRGRSQRGGNDEILLRQRSQLSGNEAHHDKYIRVRIQEIIYLFRNEIDITLRVIFVKNMKQFSMRFISISMAFR